MYYYDIYLCFDEQYRLFYNWDKSLIERYLKVEIIKVKDIRTIINNIVKVNLDDKIYLLSDGINAIAVDVINHKINCLSSLSINDEDEIIRLVSEVEYQPIKLEIIEARINDYTLNELVIPKKVFSLDIENGEDDFIKYLYYYIFNKKSNNIELMRKKLLKDINTNFSDQYFKLYEIIYK